jgi:hypothetical protein
MNKYASHPWYVSSTGLATTIRDNTGRVLASIVPNADPQCEQATARLIAYAPTLLISLRFAVGLLRRAGNHEDLCKHLQAMVDLVEPEGKAERAGTAKAKASRRRIS